MRILEVDGTRADTVYLFLDATGQETGLYTLTVTVRDRVSGESADRETDLFAGVTEHYLTKKSLSRFSVRLSQVLRHRSSWLFGVLAALGRGQHETAVLDGPGPQQDVPVGTAGDMGEGAGHGDQLGAGLGQ